MQVLHGVSCDIGLKENFFCGGELSPPRRPVRPKQLGRTRRRQEHAGNKWEGRLRRLPQCAIPYLNPVQVEERADNIKARPREFVTKDA